VSNASQNRDFRIRLKSARQGAGFTPGDLADELAASGNDITVATVSDWENGKDAPKEWEKPIVVAAESILGAEGQLTEALGW
jgi:DNA-binding transcriptional regulator YiaG